jgi:hypothetical protein
VGKGDYLVVGEVKNFGSEALQFNLTATFYDSSGYVLGTSYLSDSIPDASGCYLHVLLPDAKSPFQIWFSRFDEQGDFRLVDHYDLTVISSPAGAFSPGLEIVSHSSHEAGGSLFVEGSVKNTCGKLMNHFSVYVTYYNLDGEVAAVAMETAYASSPISQMIGFGPGETGSFTIPLSGFNDGGRIEAISNYEVVAEGYDNTLYSSHGYVITPGAVYVLGSPQETIVPTQVSEPPYLVYVLAGVLVVVVVVVVVLLVMKRAK